MLLPLLLTAALVPQAETRAPRNLVLICWDTVRADHLGPYGHDREGCTPNVDRWAAGATVFEDVTACACWTKPSVPSYMTGTLPLQHGVYRGSSKDAAGVVSDVLPADSVTLAEVLQGAGFQTAAYIRNAQLRRGQGIEQGFDVYDDDGGDAREIRWKAMDFLLERDPERPFLLYLHMLDAHWPYPVPDEYATRYASAEAVERFRGKDWKALRDEVNHGERPFVGAERDEMIALYDGAISYLDHELGRLLAFLEREGLMEDTAVALISDHGEEFGEHGRIGHGHGLYQGLLHVPWILSVPGQAPRRVKHAASLLDLMPTLLGVMGIEAPPTEGIDQLAPGAAARPAFAEHLEPGRYERSLTVAQRKFIERFRPRRGELAGDVLPARGLRLEVELRQAGRALVATDVDEDDEEDETRTELKGPLEVRGRRLSIAGIPLELAEGWELYGTTSGRTAEVPAWVAGELVKAVGRGDGDGLLCEKVKLYGKAAEEGELELRGAFGGSPSEGVWTVGGQDLRVPPAVRASYADDRDLDRETVARWFTGEPRKRDELLVFDLGQDPGELTPLDGAAGTDLLPPLVRTSVQRRIWTSADRTTLSSDELESLRAIGYGD